MEQVKNESVLLFACPGCNAQMYFNPKLQELECTHCGTHVPIEKSSGNIKENSLQPQLNGAEDASAAVEQMVYKCGRCGAQAVLTTDTATYTCSYCNFEMVNPVAYKTRVIQPAGIVPFQVDKQQSDDIFKTWLGKGIWAPRDLKKFAKEDGLHGVYLPFWTFDSQTHSDWTGYGGRYYYITEEYTDNAGKTQTRRVQKTEWIYRSGTYDQFFDDVLIAGSTELGQAACSAIYPYRLGELEDFDARFISGWEATVYNVPVKDAYAEAEAIMGSVILGACQKLCCIDTYKDVQAETEYYDQTYKHILLPVWMCTYLYKQKKFSFLINGQTGKIYGKKPVSAVKVVITVFIILAIIILIIYFANQPRPQGQ